MRYSIEFVKEYSPVYDKEQEKQLTCFELDDLLRKLQKENEQLKLDNKRLLSDYTDVCNENIALENENEQLKTKKSKINRVWERIT